MDNLSYFQSEDGLSLKTRSWTITNPKANIVIIHGYLEHCGRYDHEALYFNHHGYNVYAYDQRGHGLSDGQKSYIDNFEALISDFKLFLQYTIESNDAPYFIFSHSMGGLVALSYLLNIKEKSRNFKGVVFSAPFIMPSKNLAPMLQKVSHILGNLLPKLKTISPDPNEISRDPSVVKDYINDPLIYHDKVHARSGQQLLKQMQSIRPKYSSFKFPVLILHGTDDKLAEFEGSERFFNECLSNDKSFIPLKDFKHEITREIGKEKVLQSIANWYDERI